MILLIRQYEKQRDEAKNALKLNSQMTNSEKLFWEKRLKEAEKKLKVYS